MLSWVHEGSSCSFNVSVHIWCVFNSVDGWQCCACSHAGAGSGHSDSKHSQSVKSTETRLHWTWLEVSWNVAGISYCDLYSTDASWGFCVMGRKAQRELNVDSVVYLNTSMWVGGLAVIHAGTALFTIPSCSSAILCLPLSLFRIPSLLPPPSPPSNLPIPSQCTSSSHCFVASSHFTVCCLICCAALSLPHPTPKHTHTHIQVCMHNNKLTSFCMTKALIPASSITTSTYPCQQAVRAVPAGKGGQLVADCFTLHLTLSVCFSIKAS